MPKGKVVHQINIKLDEKDLALIDAKADRYGISRSAWIKLSSITGDLSVNMQQELRRPTT